MATHSSILAWRIPWTEEPGGLQSTGSQRVRHSWVYTHTHTHTPFQCPRLKSGYWTLIRKKRCWGLCWHLSDLKHTCGLREWAEASGGKCTPQQKPSWFLRPPLWLTTFQTVSPWKSLFLNHFPPEATLGGWLTLGEGNPRRQVEKVRPGHQAVGWRENEGKIFILTGSCGWL